MNKDYWLPGTRVDPALKKALEKRAREQGRTVAGQIRWLIERDLKHGSKS